MIVATGAEISTTTDVTGIDYGGQALTQGPEITAGSGPSYKIELWYLLEAGITAASGTTITVTYSNSPADEMIAAATYGGVDQTTPIPEQNTDSTSSSTPNPLTGADIVEAVDNVVVGAGGTGQASSATWNGAMTEQVDLADASSVMTVADRLSVTNANVDIEPTWASQNRAGLVSIEIAETSAVPVYNIDLLDVYESSSTTLDSGTAICINVDTDTAQTCGADLVRGRTYRFEIEVDNTGAGAGSPTSWEFRSSVGAGDTLGSIPVGNILNSGCSTTTDWIESVVSTDAIATSGATCEIPATTGTIEFWMIVTIDTDSWDDTSTFFITDGTVTDTSATITFTGNAIVTDGDTVTEITEGIGKSATKLPSDVLTAITETKIADYEILAGDTITTGISESATRVGSYKRNNESDTITEITDIGARGLSESGGGGGGGGGGGDSSPPEVISMNIPPSTEIFGGKLLLEPDSLLNLESLFVIGEEIDLEFEIFENSGTGIEHISLYTNIRDGSTLYDSDLFLQHNRGKPVITQDLQGVWESSDVTITEDGTSTKVVFHVIFSKPMDTSDIIIRTWDIKRNSWDYKFENIWQVIEVPSIGIITNDKESGELTPDQEPVFSWERFNEWAGYSQDILSDEEFLEHIGVEGEKIPSWIKKNNAKWVKDGLITQNDLVLALENLKSRGII